MMTGGHCEPPRDDNNTIKELEDKLKHEEEQRRKWEEQQHKWEEERKKQEAADRQRREEDECNRKEEAERQQRREEEEKLRREEEAARMEAAMRRLEEQERQAKLREEEVRLAVEREEQLRKDLAEQQRKTTEEREAHQRLVAAQAALTKKREEEAAEARRQEEKLREEAEERLLRAEEERIKYEREIERQKMDNKRRETEARVREEQARKEAEELKRRADEEREAFERELEATNKQLKDGIQPIVYPTQEEYDAAKVRVQYSAERLHAAICGPSGSGKSSLINALRGLKSGDPGAAGVGVIETTSEVTRYPDPRTVMPYPRFIWFDVPGAGTFDVPAWQYFNQQGLFIFDFIVLVYDIVSFYAGLCAFPSRLLTNNPALHADRRGCARKLPALQDPRAHRAVEGDAANREPARRSRLQFSRGAP